MRFRFIMSEVGKGLTRNLAMTISVVLVSFVSLLFVGAAVLLQTQIDLAKNDWYDRVEVSAFLCAPEQNTPQCAGGEVTQEQINDLNAFFLSEEMSAYVDEVHFETKDEAYETSQNKFMREIPFDIFMDRITRARSLQ